MQHSALILAGGQSRRMGRDKAWLEFEGRPLIMRALETARTMRPVEIFISGRADVDYTRLGGPVLLDLEPDSGPLGGIERGLEAAASPLLLVLAVDLPHMTNDFLEKLVALCDDTTGLIPQLNGQLEPLAAIYPKRCHALVRDFLASKAKSAREFAALCVDNGALKTFPVAPADSGCFVNWNSPADVV